MKQLLIILMVAAGLVVMTGCPSRHHNTGVSELSDGVSKDLVLQHMNSYRSRPLVRHRLLDQAAQAHADWMAKNGKLSHQQGWFGSKPSNRVSDAGYQWRAVAENIAQGQRSAKEVCWAWYNSPGHRTNMQGDYRHTGIGIAYGQDGSIYWVTVFANPA